jgi:hypothetical protein
MKVSCEQSSKRDACTRGESEQKTKLKMTNKQIFKNTWLAFVNIKAKKKFNFNDLIDFGNEETKADYSGAWINIIVKAESISGVVEIIPKGLDELNFETIFIDKIENIESLIEYDQVNEIVMSEVDWLLKSNFVFKISDKIFPYE